MASLSLPPGIGEHIRRRVLPTEAIVQWYMLRLLLQQVVDGVNPTKIHIYEVNNPDTPRVKAVFEQHSNAVGHMRDVINGGYTYGNMYKKVQPTTSNPFVFYNWWKTNQDESIVLNAYNAWKSSYIGPSSDSNFDLFEMSFIIAVQQI